MTELKQLEQSTAQKAMNLKEWRKSRADQYHEEILPSGLGVTLRDVDMTDVMLTGKLPSSVLELAEEAAEEDKDELDLQEIGLKLTNENPEDFMTFLNAIATSSMHYPKIGDTSDDEHITIDELSTTDKMFIMQFVNRGAGQIRPFRQEQDVPVEAVQPGDGVREATERDHPDGDAVE